MFVGQDEKPTGSSKSREGRNGFLYSKGCALRAEGAEEEDGETKGPEAEDEDEDEEVEVDGRASALVRAADADEAEQHAFTSYGAEQTRVDEWSLVMPKPDVPSERPAPRTACSLSLHRSAKADMNNQQQTMYWCMQPSRAIPST